MKNKNFPFEFWVVCCVKNEAKFLKEWIEYYRMIGADRIVLYSCSTDNTYDVVKPYIDGGWVIYFKNGPRRQVNVYNHSLNKFARPNRYIAYVDVDEFLRCPTISLKKEILSLFAKMKYKNIGNLCISWSFFGSSCKETNDYNLVTSTFLYRAKENCRHNAGLKSVIDSSKAIAFFNPHVPVLQKGYFSYNCDGRLINKLWDVSNISFSNIVNNHYFVKSKEDFFNKINRGTGSGKGKRLENDFFVFDLNEVYDPFMLKFKKYLESKYK